MRCKPWRGSPDNRNQLGDLLLQVYDMPDVITKAKVGNYISEVQLQGETPCLGLLT
jgi:hypothetical protein